MDNNESQGKDFLYILWTTDNPITARHMVFLYADDCLRQGRFAGVHILVWGASVLLLSQSKPIANEVRKFQSLGGQVRICRRCAEKYGILVTLERMEEIAPASIEYLADSLTEILKSGHTLLTL
ncbi:MAG: hypothetical protein LBJ14_10755 [Desulfarculales bacterium]|jgi:hypothetical protein|nr:hypothetical protein [Desulfarculales bacterium]